MDREGDNYDLMTYLHASSIRHVIRLAHNRNLVGSDEKIKERALGARCVFRRPVNLSPRKNLRELDAKAIHGYREARTAELAVSAVAVEIRRSNNHSPGVPPSLKTNVVTVTERGCPRGVEPVSWFLVTTEPIDTRAQIEFIVDAYRTRWIIEEFFKAIKTGCQFERRQLESYQSLENALAIFLPIAVRLLALRGAARADPGGRAMRLHHSRFKYCVSTPPASCRLCRPTRRPLWRWPSLEGIYAAMVHLAGPSLVERSNVYFLWKLAGISTDDVIDD
jgi:hypothetical protein